MDGFTAAYFQDPADPSDPALNFLGADVSGLPPTIIAPAEIDVLHDEGVAMAKHLTEAGVDTQLMVADGMVHIYFSVPHVFPATAPFVQRAAQAMGKLMKA
jgi:acetyl esterase